MFCFPLSDNTGICVVIGILILNDFTYAETTHFISNVNLDGLHIIALLLRFLKCMHVRVRACVDLGLGLQV